MTDLKLTLYQWVGVDHSGQILNGKIYAINSQLVEAQLKTEGIEECIIKKMWLASFFKKPWLKYSQLTSFLHELLMLLKTGINLVEALHLLQENCKNYLLLALLKNIRADIDSGQRLSQAIKNCRTYFGEMVAELIDVGEQTGTLEIILSHLISYRDKVYNLKKQIINAMIYPGIVISLTTVVIMILVLAVLPRFAHLYQSFSLPLPWATRCILTSVAWIKKNFLYVLFGFLFVCWQVSQLKSQKSLRDYFYQLQLKIPWLKQLLVASALSQSLFMLAMLLRTGTALVQALEMLVKTSTNDVYKIAWQQVLMSLIAGQSFSEALIKNQLFPHRLQTMVRLGEESGSLDQLLQNLAEYYQEEVDQRLHHFEKLLEPILMLLLSVIVGSLLIAMYLPIFRMGSVL